MPWPSRMSLSTAEMDTCATQASWGASHFNISHWIMQADMKVLGMGSAGLDYLAQIAAWPNPDDKLRTEKLETQGGGNCANALTAAARLGLCPYLISKIGDDGLGDQIIAELEADGVKTDFIFRAENSPSPFTYIIVDRAGGTRTCIHTPSAPLEPKEVEVNQSAFISDASLVYFDGRLTEAACSVARAAKQAGIPILVEAERLRPNLESLLQEADFVSSSAKFPQAWTGEEKLADALVTMLSRLPLAKWAFVTLGAKGAVLLERAPQNHSAGALYYLVNTEQVVLENLLQNLWEQVDEKLSKVNDQAAACITKDGVEIRQGVVVDSGTAFELLSTSCNDGGSAAASRAAASAAEEAARNAGGGSASSYAMRSESRKRGPSEGVTAKIYVSSSAQLPPESVKDTTGAGDASVGTLLYAICTGMPLTAAMKLAAVVSAAKCTGSGARSALPERSSIRQDLL